jgi:hypothetical protein
MGGAATPDRHTAAGVLSTGMGDQPTRIEALDKHVEFASL